MTRVRVATWNIHGGVGLDRRFDAERIARVIAELDADVVALQEVAAPRGFDLPAHLERIGGHASVVMPTFVRRGCDFGNAILTRLPLRSATRHELGIAGREPRNAIDVVVDCRGTPLRVIATHFGLRAAERVLQATRLCELAGAGDRTASVLVGDVNEWRARGAALAMLDRRFGALPTPRTFPALRPILALDRCWVDGPARCIDVRAHASRTARIASDHLPLVATIEVR